MKAWVLIWTEPGLIVACVWTREPSATEVERAARDAVRDTFGAGRTEHWRWDAQRTQFEDGSGETFRFELQQARLEE